MIVRAFVCASLLLSFFWCVPQVPAAKARGLPDSGFFLDGNYTRDGKSDYEARMANLFNFMNSAAGLNPLCVAKLGYKCLFAMHLLPFITTPVFATNSVYDATMGNGDCDHSGIVFNWNNASTVNACGNFVRSLVKTLLKAPSAAFLDSCKHHCGEWGQITIDGLRSPTAVQVWYDNGATALPNSGYMDQDQVFPCAACCSS